MSRLCPHPECSTAVPLTVFACRPHWFSLPPDIRSDISITWTLRNMGPGGEQAAADHEDAKESAMRFWAEKRNPDNDLPRGNVR